MYFEEQQLGENKVFVISKIENKLMSGLYKMGSYLNEKHKNVIQNKWIVWVIILIALLSGIAYAFYCTSKGYSFSGKVKWNWPKVWDIGIGCNAK